MISSKVEERASELLSKNWQLVISTKEFVECFT